MNHRSIPRIRSHRFLILFALPALCLIFTSCSQKSETKELEFTPHLVADNAVAWWARTPGDLNGDGLIDLALQNDNSEGGWLGWLEASKGGTNWTLNIITEKPPAGDSFACGDLDIGDIDNDGDLDILGIAHPGERDDADAESTLYWYANPDWAPHRIGIAPDFIKDLNLVDFNQDGKLDLVTITFIGNTMSIFRQDSPQQWTKVQEFTIENLHEGMDVGDIDGDGDLDIAANGYWVENPGGNLKGEWIARSIDEKWHNQDGNWSRNACKVFCQDINGDGRVEIFMTHSEREGYPVVYYQSSDPRKGEWEEVVILEELPAAHTLQVFDADLDGDYDILTGVNHRRATLGLDILETPIVLMLNQGDNRNWEMKTLSEEGIYNGQVADVDGDGDMDIFQLSHHFATDFNLYINKVR